MPDQEATGFGVLPWHREAWERLQGARQRRRLAHALLLSGPEGLGKHLFAGYLAQSLLCEAPDAQGIPCGRCRGCHLFLVGTHPDFRRMEPDPESKSREIRIQAVRELTAHDHLTAQSGGYKITVISPAEQMNTAAANSLLKTLEEPSRDTLLLLITARPSGLAATIRSRCQPVQFRTPPLSLARDWLGQRVAEDQVDLALGLSGGAPLAALALVAPEMLSARARTFDQFLSVIKDQQDPVAIGEDWAKQDIDRLLKWMSGWLIDMLRLQTGHTPPALFNPDQQGRLRETARKLEPAMLQRLLQDTYQARHRVTGNLNPQLMLEKLLIDWSNISETH